MGKQRRLLDEYRFAGFRPQSEIQGIFGDPYARIIRLKRIQKNDLRMLRCGTSKPLRQESAADAGSVLWGCSDISGGGGAESPMQEVQDGETRETALAGKQSLLHEAICLPRGTEVSSNDRQGCSKGIEAGLAHGKDTGKRVHAGAAATQCRGGAQCNRDR